MAETPALTFNIEAKDNASAVFGEIAAAADATTQCIDRLIDALARLRYATVDVEAGPLD